ncbi:hypothetical protein [Halorarius litoreus]|nr:hypothetical protein [Halorarius litoreus]
MSDAETDPSVRLSWIVIFLLLTLGLGAAAVLAVGGQLIAGSLLLPALV